MMSSKRTNGRHLLAPFFIINDNLLYFNIYLEIKAIPLLIALASPLGFSHAIE